jgi:hypothetical protein
VVYRSSVVWVWVFVLAGMLAQGCGQRESSQSPSQDQLGVRSQVPGQPTVAGPKYSPGLVGAAGGEEHGVVEPGIPPEMGTTQKLGSRTPGGLQDSLEPTGGVSRLDKPLLENPLRPPQGRSLPLQDLREAGGAGRTHAPSGKRVGKGKGEPFDPIKENGPIFVGWPVPKFALVITGRADGYLEPCGCAGLDRMKGGLSRRYSMFKQLREQWNCPVVGLDVGGYIKGFGRQTELKFHLTVEAMRQMGYEAITFGVRDLRLPAGELLAVAAGLDSQSSLYVSANVGLFGFAQNLTPQKKVIEVAGVRLGVTAILGDSWHPEVNNPDIQLAPAEEKLKEIVPQLKQEADILILLAHASHEESWKLGERYPEFDIVVTAGTPPSPPPEPMRYPDGRMFIEVGTKGMDAIVLGFFASGEPKVRYQRVPLDSRFPQSPEVLALLVDYQEQLKLLGFEGLGVRPAPNPKLAEMGQYVGSKKCETCHEVSYDVWRKSGHAKAWRTLKELEIPRTHDPECISCHVVGWHPTEYFPYEGGFWSEETTPHLVDVGCEACHGPGENHIRAEMGSDFEAQERFRTLVRLTLEDARNWQCVSCHDLDNSPDFDFDTYWPLIEHNED